MDYEIDFDELKILNYAHDNHDQNKNVGNKHFAQSKEQKEFQIIQSR